MRKPESSAANCWASCSFRSRLLGCRLPDSLLLPASGTSYRFRVHEKPSLLIPEALLVYREVEIFPAIRAFERGLNIPMPGANGIILFRDVCANSGVVTYRHSAMEKVLRHLLGVSITKDVHVDHALERSQPNVPKQRPRASGEICKQGGTAGSTACGG
jgi:hypothetical protein